MNRLPIFIFILLFLSLDLSAQEFKISKLEMEQNLSSKHVQAIIKDADGYMWFGTFNGLNRYDGIKTKIFLGDKNDSSTINNNNIYDIFEGIDGNLWIKDIRTIFNVYNKEKGVFIDDFDEIKNRYKLKSKEISKVFTDSQGRFWFLHPYDGLTIYDRDTDQSKHLISNPKKEGSLNGNNATDIEEDPSGNFWLVYDNGTIDILSGSTLKVIQRISIDEIVGLNQKNDLKIKLDQEGDAWVFCPNYAFGVFLLDHNDFSVTTISALSEGMRLNNSLVKTVLPHSSGLVLVGTDHGGINIVDKYKKQVRYLLNEPDNPNSLSNNAVYSLYEDDQGIVWIGTFKGGVEIYHPHSSRFALVKREIDTTNPFPWNDVNAFEESASGEIFIGTNGGGLWKYSPENGSFSNLNIVKKGKEVLPEDLVVVDMLMDHEGVLWIGTYQDGLYALDGETLIHYEADADDPDGLKDSNVWKIFEDSKNRLWIGTLREGLFYLDREKQTFVQYRETGKGMVLTNGYITGITEDKKGNIWVSGNNGINVFNPETGYQMDYLANTEENFSGLSSNEVSDLIRDAEGVVWVSTNKGLCYFDEQSERFVVFNEADAVKNKFLVGLVADHEDNLWLSSQEGIIHAKIDRSGPSLSAEFRMFNSKDGLQGDYYNKNAIFLTSKGNVYFGGSEGVNFVDPATFPFYEDESPIVFSDFQLFNHPVTVNEEVNGRVLFSSPLNKQRSIVLNHDENIFSVSFSSMNYLNPDKSSFLYMLEGFNQEWTSLNKPPFQVSFTNLDPGNYRLLVKASNIDGIPGSKISAINIEVLAPFWKTNTAYFLYFISFIILLLIAWRWFVAKERLRLKRLDEIKEINRLAELDQMKSRFFTNISHEFRTPLTLILAPIEKLMEKEGEDSANFYLKTIQKNAKKLLGLVNQLMDVKNIEMQTIKLVLSEGDIISLIEDQVRTFQSLSVNTNIGLTFSSDVRNIPCSFDIDKVKKIINNLLSNAFKFTPSGGEIDVSLKFKQEGLGEGVLAIIVTDTGIGIPQHLHQRIFAKFYSSQSNQNQGTGIGLALVSEFSKMHGGSVSVSSEPGKGATFTVRLPLVLRDGYKAKEEYYLETGKEDYISTLPSGEPAPKPRLLLVEDNADLRKYLEEVLKDDYIIDVALDGKAALEMAQNQIPDIILSDLLIPEMDGATLCKIIKNNLKTSHVPVVLLTAKTEEEDHLLGIASGCNLFLEKPFNLELLRSGLQNLLDDKKRLQKHYRKIISVETSPAELESVDDKLIQRAISMVEKEIENPDFSVEVLSKELGMSRMHLYKKINSLTGQSPLEFIRSIRMQRAAQLLKMNQYSVSEVAYKVGFNNAKYFSKHFKNNFGVLPSQYQKNNNEQ